MRPVKHKAKKKMNRGKLIFLSGLGIYTLILVILGACFLRYTDKCLREYEAAQPNYAMEDYMTKFTDKVNSGQLPDEVSFESQVGSFEKENLIRDSYIDTVMSSFLRYERAPGNYTTEKPVYRIYSGANAVADVAFEAYNERTIFGILTIMDWKLVSVTPIFEVTTSDYYVQVPDDFQVMVNGKPVGPEYLTGNTEEISDLVYAKQFAPCPQIVEYKIPQLVWKPSVVITDSEGKQYTPEENGNRYTAFYTRSDDVPEECREFVLGNAQTWSLFMTNDIADSDRGLKRIQSFLIKDSEYYKMAKGWATGIDITFTSKHTLTDPPFTEVRVDDYVKYSDTMYSCHVYFKKTLYLTRKGEYRVDTTDTTFVVMYYDDTDDGVDNPKWLIADMITNMEE